jgi:hypothetical protein
MKSFMTHLTESIEKSKYTFIIKIAGDIPDHCEATMKQSLDKFEVTSFEKIRTTPIQNKLPDFPSLENAEVTVFQLEVSYPTTSLVLQSYIAEQTGISISNIKVRSSKEEDEDELNAEHADKDKKSKPLLMTDYAKEKSANLHGEKAVSSFLKGLQHQATLTQYKGVNDQLLAKSSPKEKN